MTNTIQRTVQFYWLCLRSCDSISNGLIPNVNWGIRLDEFQKRSWENRKFGDAVFESVVGKQYPVLAVFEQFEPNYMQLIDQEHRTVTDFWDNELRASTELLAKSSAFAFFPENALIGRVSGNAGKSTKSFVGALNHFWPVKGFKWDVDPVVTKDSVARFEKELKGLNSFSASFSTRPMLDPTDEIAGDVGAFYKEWAEMAGADFDVEIKVTLAGNNMYERARRKFKEVAGDFIKSAADQGVRAKVSGVDLADKLLELNLVSHPVVEQSEITISHGESRQFTGLIDHLVSVCVQKESYLYELSRNEQ